MSILNVEHVKKIYASRLGAHKTQALSDVTFTVEEGEFVAIMGESGSGKTTLLNILATLDQPTEGEVTLMGRSLHTLKDSELCAFRREHLGFVFQDFNLLDTFTLRDNILLPLVLSETPVEQLEPRLKPLAELLSIAELLDQYPYEVSGGQKQRAAVARALITKPALVLADEPTGALDSKASKGLLEMFEQINRCGQTCLMVTHSAKAASYAGRVLFIKDGVVFHQIYRGDAERGEFYQRIVTALSALQNGGEQA